jgi:putative membrane protein
MAAEPENVDATRRTHLANERTYLAWWRSGLTAIALAIGIGRVIPEIVPGASWPWAALGTAFGVLGVLVLGYGVRRQAAVDRALRRGEYAPFTPASALLLGVFAGALGVVTIILVLAGT